jgi:hypothetical protein
MFNEIVNLLKNQTIMKKLITITFLSGLCFILFQSSIYKVMRVQGAEPGHTGSPGDGKDCTVCHGGDATTVAGWINSNIPASGYVPGERYTITTTNNEVEGNRFGFQVSPQNVAGDLLGTLIVTDSVETQLVGDGKYMTYTENGVFGISSKTWTFDWIAPSEDVDEVTFFGAYNSNFEGHKGSNHVFLSTLKVNRGWGASKDGKEEGRRAKQLRSNTPPPPPPESRPPVPPQYSCYNPSLTPECATPQSSSQYQSPPPDTPGPTNTVASASSQATPACCPPQN